MANNTNLNINQITNNKLNGLEAKQALIKQFTELLDKDSRLRRHLTFDRAELAVAYSVKAYSADIPSAKGEKAFILESRELRDKIDNGEIDKDKDLHPIPLDSIVNADKNERVEVFEIQEESRSNVGMNANAFRLEHNLPVNMLSKDKSSGRVFEDKVLVKEKSEDGKKDDNKNDNKSGNRLSFGGK